MTLQERKAIVAAFNKQAAKDTATREAAQAAMKRYGFHSQDGKLAPEYGGRKRTTASRRRRELVPA
jgi:hypothetical protein